MWPLDEIDAVVATCREHDLAAHLDGARLVNAAVAAGVEPARIGRGFDTVTLCFSKGLGCPLGALIAGASELMLRARAEKQSPFFRIGSASGVEFALEGLYLLRRLSKESVDDRVLYGAR